jgi:predicted RNA-binding protein with TRAM domain
MFGQRQESRGEVPYGFPRDRYVEIPEDLLCLYTARIESHDGAHVIDVPDRELHNGDIEAGGQYRVALLSTSGSGEAASDEAASAERTEPASDREPRDPPVTEGDRRTVEIENLGDQGDGIARVERGYVVIVPETDVGDEVTIEIEDLHPNFAMATVIEDESLPAE